ncbi:MFS transporter [Prosthecobacter sp.]|uniref:MFS transporter n=1 Tax=Prosthecobacter sp. TaxID=1965333 RepID=UPI001DEA5799|nr:MFS transporter [Prosthecobacter sp.]MCB1275661.1 MFS transporter [Prosthecobacter sp.]
MTSPSSKWYSNVTRYQWLVLLVASLGWVFDAFEGQLFNLTRGPMLSEILGVASDSPDVKEWGDVFLGIFLAGGTLGGLLFGSLGDKIGRKPVMVITILFYSVFSGLTYFAADLWHVGVLRFLVAMGVGGEWAVAAALVAEIFPKHARTHAGGIFHATGVLGTWIATLTSMGVQNEWRIAYLIGIVPAILTLWVRSSVKEPDSWHEAKESGKAMGSFADLFGDARWRKRALLGMALAAVGLGTFWGVCVATQDLTREFLLKLGYEKGDAEQKAKFAYGIIQVLGAGVGQLSFGPICARWGRKSTFALMHIASFVLILAVCFLPQAYWQVLVLLPLFGFASLSIHSGYAIYFPELFPNHLRATGSSFCFNAGRLLAAPILIYSGKIKAAMPLPQAIALLGCLFLVGLLVLAFLPETKDQDLPEG